MKKETILIVSLIVIFLGTTFMIYPTGSPGGKTGSPGDGGSNCTVCHGGSASTVQNWISSDIPAQGYTPGNTYQISVTGTGSGNKGFEITAEDAANAKVGTFTAGSGSKLTNNNHALTHTTDQSGNPHTWNFTWTAPAAGTGDVTFYAAVVVSKPNINLTSLQISENTSVNVKSISDVDISIKPNPASDIIKLKSEKLIGQALKIYTISGKLIYQGVLTEKRTSVDISSLNKGIYLLKAGEGAGAVTKRFIKN